VAARSLTDAAGALILKRHGVTGPDAEFRRASAEIKGHALTLALIGRYLRLAFDPPDIARRDCFGFGDADKETSEVKEGKGHTFRVIAAYERWFESEGRHVEAAILRLLGLFDRPGPTASPPCAPLRSSPASPSRPSAWGKGNGTSPFGASASSTSSRPPSGRR
jgi:hypothetical protein